MASDAVAGGGHTVALGLGKTGAYASANGRPAKKFELPGELDAQSLAIALSTEFGEIAARHGLTVLIIGTRQDGTPGWDGVDPDWLLEALAPDGLREEPLYKVEFLSEAQALNRKPGEHSPAAWIILATALREPELPAEGINVVGSARWWVEQDGKVVLTNMHFVGQDFGQIYKMGGDNFADAPDMVASWVRDLLAEHPELECVYIWSQDGMAKFARYYEPGGRFWKALKLPPGFDPSRVVILPNALEMLSIASAPHGTSPTSVPETAADGEPSPAPNGWRPPRTLLGPTTEDPPAGEE